ncbi:MAG TPA: radical SAM protein [bacterium]|nr:radical SAM protein [bacterium]HOL48094.1 radical SAM protein [bacterium]HPQ19331.1 radical SAM protein [bacterium]
MKEKLLFINPPSKTTIYKKAKVKNAVPYAPVLSLVSLFSNIENADFDYDYFDLNLDDYQKFIEKINSNNYYYYLLYVNTPLYYEVKKIISIIRKYSKGFIIIGGPHISALPKESLIELDADFAVCGEGEEAVNKIISNNFRNSLGIFYKENNKIYGEGHTEYKKNLDDLKYNKYNKIDISRYKNTKLICRREPLGFIETSRGCVFGCIYCNKNIFGRQFRYKTPERVVDEFEYMKKVGFNELYVVDDGFTTNLERAKKICELIIRKNIKINWALQNGIRVDCIDFEIMQLLKKSGCYRVSFGIESGNQQILDKINKGEKINNIKKAVDYARKNGMETIGYFMMGLPDETEETLNDTIKLMNTLNLDIAKVSILVPYPGTPLFSALDAENKILTKNWAVYNVYSPNKIFIHNSLDWEIIYKYYKKSYLQFYLNPKFIIKRIIKGLKTGDIFYDIIYFLKTNWFSI